MRLAWLVTLPSLTTPCTLIALISCVGPGVRTRAQLILLAAEQGMVATEVAAIVRQDEETVRRWFARYLAEGAEVTRPPETGPRRRGICSTFVQEESRCAPAVLPTSRSSGSSGSTRPERSWRSCAAGTASRRRLSTNGVPSTAGWRSRTRSGSGRSRRRTAG